jgi:hypothetical protein
MTRRPGSGCLPFLLFSLSFWPYAAFMAWPSLAGHDTAAGWLSRP